MQYSSSFVIEPAAVSTANAWSRGDYDALTQACGRDPRDIWKQFSDALPETFCEWDKRHRGSALNLDLYGYDPEQEVAVFQVRLASRRYANGYLNLRKAYVLVGHNEITHAAFRHPVGAHAIRAAINAGKDSPVDVVRAAQKWMWQCTDRQLAAGIRQGDVLIVRERIKEPVGKERGKEVVLAGSHVVRAERIVRATKFLYALNPVLHHAKGQHEPVWVDSEGWHSVRVAREADAWDFSERVGD